MRFWVVKRPNNVEKYLHKFNLSTRRIENVVDVIADMACEEAVIKVVGADKVTDVLNAACGGGMICNVGDVFEYIIRRSEVGDVRKALFRIFNVFSLLNKINAYYSIFGDPIYVEITTKCGEVKNRLKLKVEF